MYVKTNRCCNVRGSSVSCRIVIDYVRKKLRFRFTISIFWKGYTYVLFYFILIRFLGDTRETLATFSGHERKKRKKESYQVVGKVSFFLWRNNRRTTVFVLYYFVELRTIHLRTFRWDKHGDISQTCFHVCTKVHCCKRQVCERKTFFGQPNTYIYSSCSLINFE